MNLDKTAVQDDNFILHRVEHFQQRWHWDCGVSCVMMLLSPEQRELFLRDFGRICQEEGIEESTWTIDLCYLLKRFGIKHTMYTSLAGVNEDYRRHKYYNRVIDDDRSRVESRFREASSSGIEVVERIVSMASLLTHLRTAPALLLVDAAVLACDICKHNKLRSEFRSCLGTSYKGHYILLVGARGHKVLYRDPSLSPRVCVASTSRLHRAAVSDGTDDDCILISTATDRDVREYEEWNVSVKNQ